MGKTKIEWTWTTHPRTRQLLPGFTFNPWWGCVEVSDACDFCYARILSERIGKAKWGMNEPRAPMADAYWQKPLLWNRQAKEAGIRLKVFCASMADVLETSADPVIIEYRPRLFKLIEETDWLIWLLLTKRPHNIHRMVPPRWLQAWPDNVWTLATAENELWLEERSEHLRELPAPVRGLSMEPLLEGVSVKSLLPMSGAGNPINWIITGGESGTLETARPAHPGWYQKLRDEAKAGGAAFFFKQWGNWMPYPQMRGEQWPARYAHTRTVVGSPKAYGGPGYDAVCAFMPNKSAAGHLLDGVEYHEFPNEQYRTPEGWLL